MSEENTPNEAQEIASLKDQAKELGIQIKGNPSKETLQNRIAEAMENIEVVEEEPTPKKIVPGRKKTPGEIRNDKVRRANKLVRIQVTNMNPDKRDWHGETFCVSNSAIGEIKKFVPFNVPWLVPQALVNMIEERQCQIIVKVRRDGKETAKGKLIKEFSVAYLDAMTLEELEAIRNRQLAQGKEDIVQGSLV